MSIETLRSFRLGGYAIFDFAISFVGVYLISPLLSKLFLKIGVVVPTISWLLLTLPLGIVVHLLVGTETLMVKNFLSPSDHYGLKILILVLSVLGFMRVKLKI